MTVADSIESFLDPFWQKPTSQHNYQTGTRRFLEFLRTRVEHEPTMSDLYETVLIDFDVWLSKQGVARSSVQTYMRAVTKWLKNCLLRQTLPSGMSLERTNALYKETLHREPPHHRDVEEFLDFPKLVASVDHQPEFTHPLRLDTQKLVWLRNRAFIRFLYSTAARQGTARSMKIRQVRNPDGTIREVITKAKGKGNKEGVLYLDEAARRAVRAYLDARTDTSEWLFISHNTANAQPISPVTAWKIVHEPATELGLDFSPHDARHFVAIHMRREGVPIEDIQEILWHSSPATTSGIYAHALPEKVLSTRRNIQLPEIGG